MATYTSNLNLKKPAGTETADIGDINSNMDLIDAGVKLKQAHIDDPTASGNSVTFIATIEQDENGEITAKKQTVQSASGSQAGLVSTGTQTFAGKKTFSSDATFSGKITVSGASALAAVSASGVLNVTNTTQANTNGDGAIKTSGGIYATKYIFGSKVYNAVWNDYAECRKSMTDIPGKCVSETEYGILMSTDKRLMAGCKIVSDTYGTCMGETEDAKVPVAVAGRVLAIPYKGSERFKVGDAVCSAPGGTVDVMTRREIRKWPDRIVGIVSEIPEYEFWTGGTKEDPQLIPVDGRIWISVR